MGEWLIGDRRRRRIGRAVLSVIALTALVSPAVLVATTASAQTATERPSRPRSFQAEPGDGEAILTWRAPLSGPVDSYTAIATLAPTAVDPDPVDPSDELTCTTAETSCVITGLTNGTEYQVKLRARNTVGGSVAATKFVTPVTPGPPIVAVTTARLYESRTTAGATTVDGLQQGTGRRRSGQKTAIDIGGRNGIPTDAVAAVVNVTVVGTLSEGFVTLFPCHQPRPLVSTLNFSKGEVAANGAIVAVSPNQQVCAFTSARTHLIVDVTGYVGNDSSLLTPRPARLYDSRAGDDDVTTDGLQQATGRRSAGQVTEVQVGGRTTIPADASGALVNVTVINPASSGFVTLYPCDAPRPTASTLNHRAGEIVANNAVVKLDAAGQVCVFTEVATDLVVDVTAALPAKSALVALSPVRLYESRDGAANVTADGLLEHTGQRTAGQVTTIDVGGRLGIPSDAVAALLNITVIGGADDGYVTIFPCDRTRPNASTLNFATGEVVANGAAIKLDRFADACLYTSAAAHVVIDVVGYLDA